MSSNPNAASYTGIVPRAVHSIRLKALALWPAHTAHSLRSNTKHHHSKRSLHTDNSPHTSIHNYDCLQIFTWKKFLWQLFVSCLTSQQHASISGTDLLRQFYMQPRWDKSCWSNFSPHPVTVYRHWANQSQRWPSTPDAWQGSHWSANFSVIDMTRTGKIPAQAGFEPRIFHSTTRPTRRPSFL